MPAKLSCCKLIVIVFCVVSFIFIIEAYVTYYMSSEMRVKVYRGQFYIVLELIMLIGSRYIFYQIFKKPLLYNLTTVGEDSDDVEVKKHHSKLYNHLLSSSFIYRLWKWSVIMLCLLAHSSYIISYFLIAADPYLFAMLCWISFGYFLHLIAALLALSALRIVCKHIIGLSSKIFILRIFLGYLNNDRYKAIFAVIAAFSIGTYSHLTTLQKPQVKYVNVRLGNLPESLDNFVIIQLSDIHLGPTVGASKLHSAMDVVNNVKPPADLVVITGDLVDSSVKNLHLAAAPLRELSPHIPKLFVTGNHEYYTGDVDNWFKYLEILGIETLHNSNRKVHSGKSSSDYLCIAGTDDLAASKVGYAGHGMDLDKALLGCDDEMPIILLAHQPNAAKEALATEHNINLILSGHTHGGQMYPVAIGAYMINPYFAGLYQHSPNSYVYVSRGTFYFGTPMKMANTMEISHITLRTSLKEVQ